MSPRVWLDPARLPAELRFRAAVEEIDGMRLSAGHLGSSETNRDTPGGHVPATAEAPTHVEMVLAVESLVHTLDAERRG